ncbi:WD repeat protein [Trichodelitschia bisporula]|uniref:WD repeat protein n=1 Tax=Trichodelitschia bisporula TaxID=703511 RepID=A0A6G1HTG4_9PEZI|nr:WD repeat protein [Trichodelitschia bisporula]
MEYHQTASSDLHLPPDSYIYTFATTAPQVSPRTDAHSLTPTSRLAVISSDNSLRIFDPETLALRPDGVYANIHTSVTCLTRFAPTAADANIFLTAGRDGRVRGWDLRSRCAALEFRNPKREALSALAADYGLHTVVAGTELEGNGPGDVRVLGWDARKPDAPRLIYEESHTDTITELRFVPNAGSETLLLSASTDGLINIFDTAVAEEDDAVFQVVNHRSALHHAGLIGGDIYGLGTDETFSLYALQSPDLDAADPQPTHFGDVREPLNCEYAIGAYSTRHPFLAVGRHSADPLVELIPLKKREDAWSFRPKKTRRLVGAHGGEIVRDIFASEAAIFSCGEDGTVKQWRPADTDVEMTGTRAPKRRGSTASPRAEKRSRNSRS